MRTLKLIGNVIARLEQVGIWLAAAGMFLMVFLTVIETLARYLFRSPVFWAVEVPTYLLTWGTAFALAYTQQVRGHIAVGFVEGRLPPAGRSRFATVLLPIYLAVVAFITTAVFRLMHLSLTEWRLSHGMEVPLFIPQLVIFIGFVLFGLQLIVDLAQAISATRRGAEFHMTKGV